MNTLKDHTIDMLREPSAIDVKYVEHSMGFQCKKVIDGKPVTCSLDNMKISQLESTYTVGEMVGTRTSYNLYCSNGSLVETINSGKELLERAGFDYYSLSQLQAPQTFTVWHMRDAPATFKCFMNMEHEWLALIPPRLNSTPRGLPGLIPEWCEKAGNPYKFYYPDVGFFTIVGFTSPAK